MKIKIAKGILTICFTLAFAFLFFASELKAETVMFSFSYGYLFPADSGYKEVYGNKIAVPEFKLGFRIIKDFYLYGTFYSFNKSGLTPELNEPATSKQQFFGGGIGYFPYLTRNLKVFVGAGMAMATYEEEAMDVKVSGNKTGLLIEGGLYLKEKFLFVGLNGSYCAASDTYEGVNFKIGGTRVSAVLGFIF